MTSAAQTVRSEWRSNLLRAELDKGLRASETVCGLGEKAEQEGDVVRSRADWTTLSQLVVELDQPLVARQGHTLAPRAAPSADHKAISRLGALERAGRQEQRRLDN